MSHGISVAAFDSSLRDVDLGYQIIIVAAVFTVLVVLTTGIRILSKLWIGSKITLDDYVMVFSLV